MVIRLRFDLILFVHYAKSNAEAQETKPRKYLLLFACVCASSGSFSTVRRLRPRHFCHWRILVGDARRVKENRERTTRLCIDYFGQWIYGKGQVGNKGCHKLPRLGPRVDASASLAGTLRSPPLSTVCSTINQVLLLGVPSPHQSSTNLPSHGLG